MRAMNRARVAGDRSGPRVDPSRAGDAPRELEAADDRAGAARQSVHSGEGHLELDADGERVVALERAARRQLQGEIERGGGRDWRAGRRDRLPYDLIAVHEGNDGRLPAGRC